jgi:hypothetical protein
VCVCVCARACVCVCVYCVEHPRSVRLDRADVSCVRDMTFHHSLMLTSSILYTRLRLAYLRHQIEAIQAERDKALEELARLKHASVGASGDAGGQAAASASNIDVVSMGHVAIGSGVAGSSAATSTKANDVDDSTASDEAEIAAPHVVSPLNGLEPQLDVQIAPPAETERAKIYQ